jgi:hypothetical protein
MESPDFDLVAASLRADAGDLQAFVEALATKLTASFPGLVKVERPRSLMGGTKPVRRIELTLADERFELEHDAGRVTCRVATLVRGIALRNEVVELGEWIDRLSRALVAEAGTSERGREALGRLLA